MDRAHLFDVGGAVAPLLAEATMKSLERWYMVKLNDVDRVEEVRERVEEGLTIYRHDLPEKLKM